MNSSFSAVAYKKPFYKIPFFGAHHYSKRLVQAAYSVQFTQQRPHTYMCFNINSIVGTGYQFLLQFKEILPGLPYGNIITFCSNRCFSKQQFNNMYKE